MKKKGILYSLIICILFVNGCAIILQKGRRSDLERIALLEEELEEFRNIKGILERRLAGEIKDKNIRLKMAARGLVITFVAEILFDSGKAILKKGSLPILNKVAKTIKEEVPRHNIGIEGYSDNRPITRSKWKSNWELSAHRALSVLHYLISRGIDPTLLRASGYGQYRPVASNDTIEGRQLNRRVEIVILPKAVRSLEGESVEEEEFGEVYEEELK